MKKPAAVYPWQAFILVSSGIWSDALLKKAMLPLPCINP